MASNEEVMFTLGEIKSELKHMNRNIDVIQQRTAATDQRVSDLQINSIQAGGVTGGVIGAVVSLGTAMITMKLKGG